MIADDTVLTLQTYAQPPPGPFYMCLCLIDSIRQRSGSNQVRSG